MFKGIFSAIGGNPIFYIRWALIIGALTTVMTIYYGHKHQINSLKEDLLNEKEKFEQVKDDLVAENQKINDSFKDEMIEANANMIVEINKIRTESRRIRRLINNLKDNIDENAHKNPDSVNDAVTNSINDILRDL